MNERVMPAQIGGRELGLSAAFTVICSDGAAPDPSAFSEDLKPGLLSAIRSRHRILPSPNPQNTVAPPSL